MSAKPPLPTTAVYRLQFLRAAKREWDKLDGSVRAQFVKALAKRLHNPRVPQAALLKMSDCYKVKLRDVGYRLVYQVQDDRLVLLTIAVGKRNKSQVYEAAIERLQRLTEEVAPAMSKATSAPKGQQ